VNLFGNKIGKNLKSQAKQASAQTAFAKKKAAPASFAPFLPPSRRSQASSYQRDNSKQQYDLDTTSSWMRKNGCGFFLVEDDRRMG
jgi:hypothetical protein